MCSIDKVPSLVALQNTHQKVRQIGGWKGGLVSCWGQVYVAKFALDSTAFEHSALRQSDHEVMRQLSVAPGSRGRSSRETSAGRGDLNGTSRRRSFYVNQHEPEDCGIDIYAQHIDSAQIQYHNDDLERVANPRKYERLECP